jgi:uncharacterized protein YcfJ
MRKTFPAIILGTGMFVTPATIPAQSHSARYSQTTYHRHRRHPHRKTVERTAIGAGAGAAVGALVGGGKGAAIGAGVGGGSGFAYDRYKKHEAREDHH